MSLALGTTCSAITWRASFARSGDPVTILVALPAPAWASSNTGVSITGKVSNAGLGMTLSVQAQAHGATAGSLSGQGMDNSVAGGRAIARFPSPGRWQGTW